MATSDLVISLIRFLCDTFPYTSYQEKFYKRRSILDKHLSNTQNKSLSDKEIAQIVGTIDKAFFDGMDNNKDKIIVSIYQFLKDKLKIED